MAKDITRKQFTAALKRNGMTVELGFMGYVKLNVSGQVICVSYFNAPQRTWRGALAYLLQQQDRLTAEAERQGEAGVVGTNITVRTRKGNLRVASIDVTKFCRPEVR